MSTGYVWDALYGWFDTGSGSLFPSDAPAGLQPTPHVAAPDLKRRIHELVAVSGVLGRLVRVPAKAASDADLLRIHDKDHVERIRALSALPKGGDAGDGVTPFGKGGFEIGALAVGGAIELVKRVVSGEVDNGYALLSPTGHHATTSTGMGFCLFNNLAAAAAYARTELGVARIAVVDWDVHHGNGTQEIWYADPSVLTISLHQDNNFPAGSGSIAEQGEGPGLGYAINIPLPPGSGDAAYLHAVDTIVAPALRAFGPELIIVACGFDNSILDPLGRQMVTAKGFQQLSARVLALAAELCGGKAAFVHEGGYSPYYAPFCALAVIRELAGEAYVEDPLAPLVTTMGGDVLLAHEEEAVERAAAAVRLG